jgi:hypothetical protein
MFLVQVGSMRAIPRCPRPRSIVIAAKIDIVISSGVMAPRVDDSRESMTTDQFFKQPRCWT